MLWKKLGFTVGILCASIGTSGVASADDKDFLAAREAYRVSDLVALSEYSTKLQGDIFAVYERIIKFYKNEKGRFMIVCSLNCIIISFNGRNSKGASYNHLWAVLCCRFCL